MIAKEIWKTKTDGNKMEKLIKCHIHMQVQHQKSVVLKKKTFSSYPKTIHCFFFFVCLFLLVGLKTHLDLIGKFKLIGKMTYNAIK